MTNNQQFAWANLVHYIVQMQADSNRTIEHFKPSMDRLKATNPSVKAIEATTILIRNAYGLGKGKPF